MGTVAAASSDSPGGTGTTAATAAGRVVKIIDQALQDPIAEQVTHSSKPAGLRACPVVDQHMGAKAARRLPEHQVSHSVLGTRSRRHDTAAAVTARRPGLAGVHAQNVEHVSAREQRVRAQMREWAAQRSWSPEHPLRGTPHSSP